MKRPFFDWKVGNETHRLKMNTTAIINIESKLNDNLAMIVAKNPMPSMSMLTIMIEASCEDLDLQKTVEVIDTYFEEDKSYTELVSEVYKPLLETSGFFSKRTKAKAQTSKKVKVDE